MIVSSEDVFEHLLNFHYYPGSVEALVSCRRSPPGP